MYVQTYTGKQRGRKKTAMEKKTSTRHPDPKRKRDKH
jgi:hypothetical protein